ncbi:MAG: decaprenyl-phosphate phosphoribosyltransferase [Chloroflexota bacterium]
MRAGPSWLADLVVSARPKQWLKNGVLILPLVFSVNLYWHPANWPELLRMVTTVLLAVGLFSALTAAQYLFNDLVDLPSDRLHPLKTKRPLAAGRLNPRVAAGAAAGLALFAIGGGLLLNPLFALLEATYLVLMVLYTLVLKHQVLLDVFAIAAGFVLRAVAGAVVIGVPVSPWLYLCVVLGALFLGFGKRRHELLLLENNAGRHRPSLDEYSVPLLDQILVVVATATVVAYSLYTFTAETLPRNKAMMLTIPLVLYGVLRYFYLIHQRNLGGSPEEALLSDRPLLAAVALWLLSSLVILYVFRGS